MKILITTDTFSPSVNGVVTSTRNLYTQLKMQGHDVRILALSQGRGSRREGDICYLKSFGIHVYPGARATASYFDPIVQELIDWAPEIIHTQTEFCTFFIAKRISAKLNIPIVHTYHTLYERYTDYFVPSRTVGEKVVATLSRELLRSISGLVTPTEKVRDVLIGYGVNSPIDVIPTGIDTTRFANSASSARKLELRREFGLPCGPDTSLLLTVGRLGIEKNIDELLENFTALLERCPNTVLVIVGDGPHLRGLAYHVEILGITDHVVFTGMVEPERLPSYYQAADIFVNASTSETQGLTYIEALASGLPEVCRYDKCLERVLKPGCNGYFFKTSSDFVTRVSTLIENVTLRMIMADNARMTSENYSMRAFGESAELLYKRVLCEHQGQVSRVKNTLIA